VDPYPLWLDAVAELMRKVGVDVVASTCSGRELLALLDAHRPDLLVTELQLDGDLDGAEYVARARESQPDLRVIVLSARSDPAAVDAALSAGASAYVVKTVTPADLASAIRLAFEHSVIFPAWPSARADGPRPVGAPAPAPAIASAGLTKRELEILKLVAEGLSNAQLARTIWVSEQTVKFHLSNIYRKLNVTNRTEASRWAQLNGLLPQSAASAVA
jgi:DNA-binding NarL/FixJ family response regulator